MPLLMTMVAIRLPKIISWKLTLKVPFTHILLEWIFLKSQTPKDCKFFNQSSSSH